MPKLCSVLLALGAMLFFALPAAARSRGIVASNCEGCHGLHQDASLALNVAEVELGETVELVFSVSDPEGASAGISIETEAELQVGPGMALVESGATHTSPRRFDGEQAEFLVTWTVPSTPGVVRFSAAAVAANGDGRNSGDEGLFRAFDVVFGCSPQTFFSDHDGDGFGVAGSERTFCAGEAPDGFAPISGDCDDNSANVSPGTVEFCNQRDDDCDGVIDEDAEEIALYPDADGDGYYSPAEFSSGDSVMGCVPYQGYASEEGDCQPNRPDVHPGAEEVCDGVDDENCDGQVDDRLRPVCGEGRCSRYSLTCDPADCAPGAPIGESCNFLDDDCDGVVDDGDLCPAGQVCAAGECRPESDDVAAGDPSSTDGSGSVDIGPTDGSGAADGSPEGNGGGAAGMSTTGPSAAGGGTEPPSGDERPEATGGGGEPQVRPASSGCSVRMGSGAPPRWSCWLLVGVLGLAVRRVRRSPPQPKPRRYLIACGLFLSDRFSRSLIWVQSAMT